MNPEKYNTSCQSNFWKTIFRVETEYLAENLKNSKNVVSIGCGPAIIEQALSNNGFNLTGVDISGEILKLAPDNIKKIVSKAEYLPFNYCNYSANFQTIIYVAWSKDMKSGHLPSKSRRRASDAETPFFLHVDK